MSKVDVTISVTLGSENGKMTITAPAATDQEDVYDGKKVTFSLASNSYYPNAYLLAVEFLDANGNPTVSQSGPFKEPPAYNGNLQTRTGEVRSQIDESSWKYRVWVYDGSNVATHDPTLLNKKG